MSIKFIDYVQDGKVEDGAIFAGCTIRIVGGDILFDFAAMNPGASRILDPENLCGIKNAEILICDDSITKDNVNHELNEDRELTDHPEYSYWYVHRELMKLQNEAKILGINHVEEKAMPNKLVRKYLPLTIRKSADGNADEIVISSINPDRGGDRVFPQGCDLKNYTANPIIMWLHDYRGATPAAGIPIGKNSYLRVTDNEIIAGPPIFLSGDAFAERVKNAWDKGFIRTASIGFAPLEEPEQNELGGYDYKKWEMLEWSLVPIPMNPEAMRIAKEAKFEDLIDDPHSQAEIGDTLDEVLTLIKADDFNEENVAFLQSISCELTKRFSAGDTAVKHKSLSQANKTLISETIELCNKAEGLCKTHHTAHNSYMKDLVAGIGECRSRLQGLVPPDNEEEEEKPGEDEGSKLLHSFLKK